MGDKGVHPVDQDGMPVTKAELEGFNGEERERDQEDQKWRSN